MEPTHEGGAPAQQPPYVPPAGAPVPPPYAPAAAVPTMDQPPSFGEQIIPTKNPLALAGYYVGVFGLIPCAGLFMGPLALVLGMLALNAMKRNAMLPGKGHAITAIVLGALATLGNWGVVVAMVMSAVSSRG